MFGQRTVLKDPNGVLLGVNKPALSEQVFSSKRALEAFTSITSPEIKKHMLEHFEYVDSLPRGTFDFMAVEGAILIEAKTYRFFDELWVVTLPKEVALERVKERNPELPERDIENRLQRQIDDKQRLKYASFSYSSLDSFEKVNQGKILE